MYKNGMSKRIAVCMLIIFASAVCFSCSAIDMKKNKKEGKPFFSIPTKKTAPPPPLYYDFKDILVPGELTEDKNQSSVIGTGENATGFLSFYGRVELRSVVKFFEVKVPEGGWKLISVMKAPAATNMIFHKGKRWCLITMREEGFTTEVGIGVSPEL